jgi:hypothetical protein
MHRCWKPIDARDDGPIQHDAGPINDFVRRAINYAFDYDGFNKDILGRLVERNPTPLPTRCGCPRT